LNLPVSLDTTATPARTAGFAILEVEPCELREVLVAGHELEEQIGLIVVV